MPGMTGPRNLNSPKSHTPTTLRELSYTNSNLNMQIRTLCGPVTFLFFSLFISRLHLADDPFPLVIVLITISSYRLPTFLLPHWSHMISILFFYLYIFYLLLLILSFYIHRLFSLIFCYAWYAYLFLASVRPIPWSPILFFLFFLVVVDVVLLHDVLDAFKLSRGNEPLAYANHDAN